MNDKIEWVMVPREPTGAMVFAGRNADDLADTKQARRIYAAMLASAPKPKAQAGDAGAIRAFEDYFEASSEDPSMEGELELWLVAWRSALSAPASHDAQQPVPDSSVNAALDAVVAEGENVRFYVEASMQDYDPQTRRLLAEEVVRTAIEAAQQPAVVGDGWSHTDMQRPWGAESAFLRHLADDSALNAAQSALLRHCAKRIESTAGIHLRALADMLDPAKQAGVLREAADALTPAATPGVEMVPYSKARDLLGDAYNAGTHGIGYSQQVMDLQDAAQKEGNGNG